MRSAQVEEAEGPKALVTVGSGKFFSNGLDLDHLGANPNDLQPYLFRVHSLFTRILSMPCATVAAQNGHTFAAGAMLAICHDHRVMREDRGYWCLPEVDLGMPFTDGMNALIPARLPPMTAHEAMVTGRRYSGTEALAAGIVNELAAEDQVLPRADRGGAVAGGARPAPASPASAPTSTPTSSPTSRAPSAADPADDRVGQRAFAGSRTLATSSSSWLLRVSTSNARHSTTRRSTPCGGVLLDHLGRDRVEVGADGEDDVVAAAAVVAEDRVEAAERLRQVRRAGG